MPRLKVTLFILIASGLFACGGDTVFEKRHSFEDLKWNRFKSVFFEFDISDTGQLYDIALTLRHHTVYPFPDLQMTAAIYTPSGERRLKDVIIPLRNNDGTFRSSGMGDLWDIEQVIYKGYSFNEKGHYKLELENRMGKVETPGVMELGLIIKKSEAAPEGQ